MQDQQLSAQPFDHPIFRREALEAYASGQIDDGEVVELPALDLRWLWGLVAVLTVMLVLVWPLGLSI